jgi:hypothetical protein
MHQQQAHAGRHVQALLRMPACTCLRARVQLLLMKAEARRRPTLARQTLSGTSVLPATYTALAPVPKMQQPAPCNAATQARPPLAASKSCASLARLDDHGNTTKQLLVHVLHGSWVMSHPIILQSSPDSNLQSTAVSQPNKQTSQYASHLPGGTPKYAAVNALQQSPLCSV